MIAMLPNEKKRHFYKIKQGDTLEKISKKLGIHISTLCKLNNIKSKQILKPGQLLKY
jgi:LysM repeat protein